MNTVFEWLGEWPPEARTAVEAAFDGLDWMVPPWCRTVAFRWQAVNPDDQYSDMSTSVNYPYRFGTVYAHGHMLSCPPTDRREDLRHELFHLFVNPLWDKTCEILARTLKADEPKLYESVRAELLDVMEACVSDLSIVFGSHEREDGHVAQKGVQQEIGQREHQTRDEGRKTTEAGCRHRALGCPQGEAGGGETEEGVTPP